MKARRQDLVLEQLRATARGAAAMSSERDDLIFRLRDENTALKKQVNQHQDTIKKMHTKLAIIKVGLPAVV